MPRPKEGLKQVSQRVPSDLLDKIDELAERSGLSRTAFINYALADYVNNGGNGRASAPPVTNPTAPSPSTPSRSEVETRTLETLGALVDAVNRLNASTAERERRERMSEGARDYMTFIDHAPALSVMESVPLPSSCGGGVDG